MTGTELWESVVVAELDECSALKLVSLVVLSKVEEGFTCPGREGAGLRIPVCCTSGGFGFDGLSVWFGLKMGMVVAGGNGEEEGGDISEGG